MALAIGGDGCATVGAGGNEDRRLLLVVGSRVADLRVTPPRLVRVGGGIEITEDAIAGFGDADSSVHLAVDEERIYGSARHGAVDVAYTKREGGGVEGTGRWNGKPVRLVSTPTSFAAFFQRDADTRCEVRLASREPGALLLGTVRCKGAAPADGEAALQMPAALTDWLDDRRLATTLLAVINDAR